MQWILFKEGNMNTSKEDNRFICPNCGGNVGAGTMHISRDYNPDDPWSSILQTTQCVLCRYTIPAHLGERWDNMSMERCPQSIYDSF